jgi:hypothetical protein
MENTKIYSQFLTCKPTAYQNPVNEIYPVKFGENLPNSMTEDIGGISLQKYYSPKQIRRIKRLRKEKNIPKSITSDKSQINRTDCSSKYSIRNQTFFQADTF